MALTRHAHLSWRYDRRLRALGAFLRFWTTRVDLVTITEAAGARTALNRVPGVRVIQAPKGSKPGASECAILTRGRVLEWWTEELSPIPIPSRGGATCHAVYALIEKRGKLILAVAVHLPSDVQDGDGFSTSPKVAIWRQSMQTLTGGVREAQATYTPAGTIVAGDWNVDHRRPVWRAWIGSRFPSMHCTWAGRMPRVGTHGNRVIDATWTDLKVRRIRVMRRWRRVSDHRGFVETLRG